MHLEFVGAAQNVTGSKHILHVNGLRILLDCGLFQGHRKETEEANKYLPFKAEEIDIVVLSHAHIDHSGAIPFLVKNGFSGPIYCTHATRDLCSIMLQDSAHIQESDAKWLQKKKGIKAKPLYTVEDANKAMTHFRSVSYDQVIPITPDIKVTFRDAGHILGSASEEWEIYDQKTQQDIRFGFTGDLGRKHLPILRPPTQLKNLDILITESTYGNRLHKELESVEEALVEKITETVNRGGKIYIPAFAVERTQEILFVLKKLMHEEKILKIPIFVDSPLATNATEIFRIHPECFDEELTNYREEGLYPFLESDGVRFTRSVRESKFLNNLHHPAIIIAASGMCENGRIVHHIANGIGDERNTLLVIGFMAQHTLGRRLVDGAKQVSIFGDTYDVRADVAIFNAFSGHADQKGLLEFARNVGDPKSVFLVHGEPEAQEVFKDELKKLPNLKYANVDIPEPGDIYELFAKKTFRKSTKRNVTCHGIVCKV